MANSKVVFYGETLIDLTGDTVAAAKLLKGITAHDKAGELVTGTCEYDSDTSEATANADDILLGETAYARGSKLAGTMPNNGSVAGVISTKDGEYTVPMGYQERHYYFRHKRHIWGGGNQGTGKNRYADGGEADYYAGHGL